MFLFCEFIPAVTNGGGMTIKWPIVIVGGFVFRLGLLVQPGPRLQREH